MNIQERIEALETEFNEKIKALKAEAQQGDEFPKRGDEYWYTDEYGTVCSYQSDEFFNKVIIEDMKAVNNIFRTKEQAEFVVEKLKVEVELRKFSEPWNLEKTQYTFSFDWECGKFELEFPDYNQYPNSYYFDSISALDLAIETVGEERIKKYIFGVED